MSDETILYARRGLGATLTINVGNDIDLDGKIVFFTAKSTYAVGLDDDTDALAVIQKVQTEHPSAHVTAIPLLPSDMNIPIGKYNWDALIYDPAEPDNPLATELGKLIITPRSTALDLYPPESSSEESSSE